MTDRELMQQALDALEVATTPLARDRQEVLRAQAALREKLAQPEQEPVAWMPIEQMYPQGKAIDILMGDGSILCAVLPQFDGDLWWEGSGTGEKFIDPKYANVTHWRTHNERTSPPADTAHRDGGLSMAEQTYPDNFIHALMYDVAKRDSEAQHQEPVALPEKIYEFVPTPEPVKWHHPECEGACIACLIEQVVQEAYGSQGLGYLQRHLTSPPAQRKPLTDEEICRIGAQVHGFLLCNEGQWGIEMARAIEAAHGIGEQK